MREIIYWIAKEDSLENAQKTMHDFAQKNKYTNRKWFDRFCFEKICLAMAENGQLKEALQVVKSNEYIDKNRLFVALAEDLARQDLFEDAIELAKSIPEQQAKIKILGMVSTKFAWSNQVDRALATINLIPINSSDGEREQCWAILSIFNALNKKRNSQKSIELLNNMIAELPKQHKCFSTFIKGRCAIELIENVAESGSFEKAMEICQSTYDNDEEKVYVLALIATKFPKTDNAQSSQIAKKIMTIFVNDLNEI
ncbi:hypothetical protein [Desulfamplus magnetovallimortis]|uniref:hypothetical protein n=1 Tax=Desulfamplus magnetovallimortis TaxID=1246637 RepID=UPI00111B8179|nr:hypothetical protein [Desulfamplus magnetovallimortis]